MLPSDSNFCLRGPFFHGPYVSYRLFEKKKGKSGKTTREHIMLQTPQVTIGSLTNTSVSISLDNIYVANSCRDLVSTLTQLETNLQSTSKTLNGVYEAHQFKPSITTWMNTNYLRLNLLSSGLKTFDHLREQVSSTVLNKGTLVKILFWVKGIRQYSDGWRLDLVALQCRIYDPVPVNKCLIEDEEVIDTPSPPTNTSFASNEYQKYRDMIAKGVPRPAVEQKCRIAGLNPALIDTNQSGGPVPTRPAISINNTLTSAILGGIKLKRCDPLLKPKPKPKKTSTNQLVPSLDDILSQLNSLRSTKKS